MPVVLSSQVYQTRLVASVYVISYTGVAMSGKTPPPQGPQSSTGEYRDVHNKRLAVVGNRPVQQTNRLEMYTNRAIATCTTLSLAAIAKYLQHNGTCSNSHT